MRDPQGDQRRRPSFAMRRGSSKLRFPTLFRRWAFVVVGVRAGEEAAVDVNSAFARVVVLFLFFSERVKVP